MQIGQFQQSLLSAVYKSLGGSKELSSIFSQGEVVDGKVLKLLAGNQALVRLRGVDLVATSQSRLAEGQNITGRVEKVSPNLTITLLSGEATGDAKAAQLMRLLLPGKAPVGDALGRIAQSMKGTELPPDLKNVMDEVARTAAGAIAEDLGTLTPEKTKELLGRSGLFMESTIKAAAEGKMPPQQLKAALANDLKASLAKALGVMDAQVATLAEKIGAATGDAAPAAASIKQDAFPAMPPQDQPRPEQLKPEVAAKIPLQPSGKEEIAAPRQDAGNVANMEKDLAAIRETAKEVRKALGSIEFAQLINSASKRDDGTVSAPLYFQIPFAQGDTVQTARLYLKPGEEGGGQGKEKKEKGGSSIVFMLNMSKLGPVRADVSVADKKIHGTVYVMNDTVAKHMKDNLAELTGSLEAAGYSAWIDVSVAGGKFITEELENYTPATGSGLINIKA
ncbi:MAG: flagellar hook-length control protein FliK [Nitrospinae bacterium]|nr:flagellar hook-length control protein FliK [Nitrospinota bacterium]